MYLHSHILSRTDRRLADGCFCASSLCFLIDQLWAMMIAWHWCCEMAMKMSKARASSLRLTRIRSNLGSVICRSAATIRKGPNEFSDAKKKDKRKQSTHDKRVSCVTVVQLCAHARTLQCLTQLQRLVDIYRAYVIRALSRFQMRVCHGRSNSRRLIEMQCNCVLRYRLTNVEPRELNMYWMLWCDQCARDWIFIYSENKIQWQRFWIDKFLACKLWTMSRWSFDWAAHICGVSFDRPSTLRRTGEKKTLNAK